MYNVGAKNSQLAGRAKPCEWGGGRITVRRGVVLCWQERAVSRKEQIRPEVWCCGGDKCPVCAGSQNLLLRSGFRQ
ncbi:hypothetical protein [Erwinia mallotivora]|uniref:Uncharacterized protein n=1 Tax=Erwinia mallotivora TaxID=69222 RepID=A0A014N4R3_9GAMM|nr:hypothetical protein [Erwinia mallotivora]EXU74403.1 hypothetical protein BG55_17415 [Erwinia mallotivora]